MANSSNKNATKSLVMLIVTGVVLVAVTLCWFVINKKTTVDNLGSAVNNDASSTAKLYEGAKETEIVNKKKVTKVLAIKREDVKDYTEITDDIIKLENMIPGAEYFFKAEFTNCSPEYVLSLILEGVNEVTDSKSLDVSKITVYREITNTSDTVKYADADTKGITLSKGDFAVYDNEKINGKVGEGETLIVYFSFKFSIDAKVENDMEKTINIESVNATISSGKVSEETSSETNNENS